MNRFYKKVLDELIRIREDEFDNLTNNGIMRIWHSEGLTHICI